MMKRFSLLMVFGLFQFLITSNGEAEEQTDKIRQGFMLAKSLCSDCHFVSREQRKGTILWPRAPSFPAIADSQKLSQQQLKEFLVSPHTSKTTKRRMPSLPLSVDYIEKLAAYIESLQRKKE